MKTLLIGGARSGKSGLALRWANERAASVCTLVTATESDPEMTARIAAHRRERPAHWRVREESVELGRVLREERALLPQSPDVVVAPGATPGPGSGTALHAAHAGAPDATAAAAPPGLVLIDCLTLWISNCLWPPGCAEADLAGWSRQRDDFLDALAACACEVIIVTNEVGTGIVPDNDAARVFRDEQGWLNQAVAAVCDEVFFVTAG